MGVHGLWSVLGDICERKPLTYLSGKKVAVDLSGWVVQAISCKGLNTSRSPHLRNLFFRMSRLLQFGVYPIFVTEGTPPAIKEAVFNERNRSDVPRDGNLSRPYFDKILDQCQELLSTLGVPCIKSSGEAEAFCAYLCLNGIVDGVITEDNDAFLYGADVVYRDFSIDTMDSHINVYCLKSEKNKLHLDRKKLVALALLLGCDYSKGVPGVGKETAIKLLNELNCDDVLQRFEDWKKLSESELFPGLENETTKKGSHCNRCGHLGAASKHKKEGCSFCSTDTNCNDKPDSDKPCKCPWHLKNEVMTKRKTELKIYNSIKTMSDFPNMKVVEEYLNFTDTVPSDEALLWNCPNLSEFQEKTSLYLNWDSTKSQEKFLPIITSWQQHKLLNSDDEKTDFMYEPVEILKERSIRDVSHFEVKWKMIDEEKDSSSSEEDLVTTEYGDRFSTCYKKLANDFYHKLDEQKKSKGKSKKFKSGEGCRKGILLCFKNQSFKNIPDLPRFKNTMIDEYYKKKARAKSEDKTKIKDLPEATDIIIIDLS